MRLPLLEDLTNVDDLPHTISTAILYRLKIDSFNELPKDKRPPRDLWNKPYKLEEFFDEAFERKEGKSKTEYIEYNLEDVE